MRIRGYEYNFGFFKKNDKDNQKNGLDPKTKILFSLVKCWVQLAKIFLFFLTKKNLGHFINNQIRNTWIQIKNMGASIVP